MKIHPSALFIIAAAADKNPSVITALIVDMDEDDTDRATLETITHKAEYLAAFGEEVTTTECLKALSPFMLLNLVSALGITESVTLSASF